MDIIVGGKFILRIEDTDAKRTVDNGIAIIIETLAKEFNISMPIITECYRVLYKDGNVEESLERLMHREVGEEW